MTRTTSLLWLAALSVAAGCGVLLGILLSRALS